MNFCRIWFLILVCNCISFCRSPSKSTTEAFVEVDASLQSSNEIADGNLKLVYDKIESGVPKGMPQHLLADGVFTLTNEAVSFIDSLKMALHEKDKTGDSTTFVTALLVNTATSRHLLNKLIRVQSVTWSVGKDSLAISYTDDLSGDIDAPMNKSWDTTYFYETPTAAAVVMLTKFQNDCYKAGLYRLRSIYKESRK